MWALEPFPEYESLTPVFRIQLDMEKMALTAYEEAASMIMNAVLRDKIRQLITEEKEHIVLVEAILSKLV